MTRIARRTVLTGGLAAGAATLLPGAAYASTVTTGGLTLRDGFGLTLRAAERWEWERRLVYLRFATREITGWGGGGPGVNVLLPRSYDAQPTRRYPVVFLYHGGGGVDPRNGPDFRDWHGIGAVEVTRDAEAIFVMPDGGRGSWYMNARFLPLARRNWETFLLSQLLPWVDANFRTHGTREGRAIAGLSMGGFGAMKQAARFPHLFRSVSGYSSPTNLADERLQGYVFVSPIADGLPPGVLLGAAPRVDLRPMGIPININTSGLPYRPELYREENPTANVARLRGLGVSLIAGDAPEASDWQEGGARAQQAEFAPLLRGHGVTDVHHRVITGGHTGPTWRRALELDLPHILRRVTPAR